MLCLLFIYQYIQPCNIRIVFIQNIKKLIFFVFLISILLTVPFLFIKISFGNATLSGIIIGITENKANDLLKVGIADFSRQFFETLAFMILSIGGAYYLLRRVNYFTYLLPIIAIYLFAMSPVTTGVTQLIFPSEAHRKLALEENFKPVKIIEKPQKQKNLVHIY